MRPITLTPAKSTLVGELPAGCKLCITGEKLVLFVSGLCPRDCFYCTLSEKRKNAKTSWANEQLIQSDEDLLKEAKLCRSRGAGITGGEPLLRGNIEKTLHYIKLLKENFGRKFHIHLYTSGIGMNDAVLKQLEDEGLDEIRFHLDVENEENWKILLSALAHKFDVGAEIPCIPGTLKKLEKLAMWLDSKGAKFLNLNEFEFSEHQYGEMQRRGFSLADNAMRQVKGSRELAQKLVSFAAKSCKQLSVHFCPAMLKDAYQYTNRIKRRAESIKKPFETVTKEGLLKKGVIFIQGMKSLERAKRFITEGCKAKSERSEATGSDRIFAELKELDFLPKNELFARAEPKRVETSPENAKKAAKKGFKAAIVLELPTADGFDVEMEPL